MENIKWFIKERLEPYADLEVPRSSSVHPSVSFRSPENVVIGERVRVQPNACLWASPNARIEIGDLSGLGPGTMVFASNHAYEFGSIYIEQPWVERTVRIDRNVWIGAGSIITAGVLIGEGSVIAGGSVVTKDVPPYSLAAGVPCRVLKRGTPESGGDSPERPCL
jgi:acetyltransferase-like isoleucine patch superfamily enzyme